MPKSGLDPVIISFPFSVVIIKDPPEIVKYVLPFITTRSLL